MFHVSFESGGLFSGNRASLWDLTSDALNERVLAPRSRGEAVWVDGQEFSWPATTVRIFKGPASGGIEDFSRILGPAAYALTEVLTDVTDHFITGPPGAQRQEITEGPHEKPLAVFIVHGAEVAWREQVARHLEHILSDRHPVIILHEQQNLGQTIIEKLETAGGHARYAVVLFTADDEGRRRGDEVLAPRARQNVVLELGYFLGSIGRANVCVLHEAGVEQPSDIHGVVYLPLDEGGGWKLTLFRELRAAGLAVELP